MCITKEVLRSYLRCQYKTYLILKGRNGRKSAYEEHQIELSNRYRPLAIAKALSNLEQKDIVKTPTYRTSDLKTGKRMLVDFLLKDEVFEMKFDALEEVIDGPESEISYYIPILFSVNERIHNEDRLLITMMSIALESAQEKRSEIGKVIYGKNQRMSEIKTESHRPRPEECIDAIKRILNNENEPDFFLNKHCKICEFGGFCKRNALKLDHLSLLPGMSRNEIRRQNKKGIFTVTQLSFTFRPRKRRRRVKHHTIVRYHGLQALSIREQKKPTFLGIRHLT